MLHKSQSFFEFIPLSVKVAKPKALTGTCFHTEYVSINYIYQTFPASASFEDKVAAFVSQLWDPRLNNWISNGNSSTLV
jgi:hypothetical protein